MSRTSLKTGLNEPAPARRWLATAIRWVAVLLIVASLAWIARKLPLGPALAAVQGWAGRLGPWGPLAFGLCYVAAVVLMVPAWPWTLAAGALFGLVVGTITASLAATLGAALAFLIARYLARGAIVARWGHHPRFRALDQAIAQNGWKIVALLRLSPAVPFNIQNYLYGLTGIRFWPYVLTSWVAMLPGTFLYVYLGHIGGAGIEAASGGVGRPRSPAEWGFLIVGLLATIAVTIYLGRLARRALSQREG
ncbi:MAG: TVP38/TMEM64 family protein [Isosphaeraceae bacterium]|nr:TVP38/TMEM64 family protein [Isosphaeraceae bacterium]